MNSVDYMRLWNNSRQHFSGNEFQPDRKSKVQFTKLQEMTATMYYVTNIRDRKCKTM